MPQQQCCSSNGADGKMYRASPREKDYAIATLSPVSLTRKQKTTPLSIRILVSSTSSRTSDCGTFRYPENIFSPMYVCQSIIFDTILSLVMVPVSSTVIPLPVYKVGYGLGFVSKDKKTPSSFKPEGSTKLITRKYERIIRESDHEMRVCAIDSFPLLVFNFLFSC